MPFRCLTRLIISIFSMPMLPLPPCYAAIFFAATLDGYDDAATPLLPLSLSMMPPLQ